LTLVLRRLVRRRGPIFLAALACLVLLGCGFPSDEAVKADFLKENPSSTIVDIGSGEGDGETVYKIIRFRPPGSAAECVVEWGYQRTEPGSRTFRVFHKGEPSCGAATR